MISKLFWTQNSKFTQYDSHFFKSIIVSTRLRNKLHAFKINSSDIWFCSSSIVVLSEPIFEWEIAFVLFSKTPPYSVIKGVKV